MEKMKFELLSDFLIEPQETPEIEIKNWLNLKDGEHKAILGKALIAIANHGGGIVIIGFEEKNSIYIPSEHRPEDISLYNQDEINGIVAHYAEPPFHCEARLLSHPITNLFYPIIRIPGGHGLPIRSKRGSPDNGRTISNNTYYIRRPGPASEPPQSGKEWDMLLERCVLAKKEDLLNSIRSILVGGEFDSLKEKLEIVPMNVWEKSCLERWSLLTSSLPADHPAHCINGKYFCSYIIEDSKTLSLKELLEKLRLIRGYSGRSPFHIFSREDLQPHPIDNLLEFWFGGNSEDSAHSDFWRVSPLKKLFLLRGYNEDSSSLIPPGKYFDLCLPIRHVGECLLHAMKFAADEENESNIEFRFTWEGLNGRELRAFSDRSLISFEGRKCHQFSFQNTIKVTNLQIQNNLSEIVYSFILPLYELFNLFQIPKSLVNDEISKLIKGV